MTSTRQYQKEDKVLSVLKKIGLMDCQKIDSSLQGSIWSAADKKTENKYVIKVTSRKLHESSSIIVDGKPYYVQENIKKEGAILKYLTQHKQSPNSIIKYIDFIKTSKNYYLIMENGGSTLFDFVVKAHNLINLEKLDISEWHKCVKVIFKQLMDTVHYLHSKQVCHFDISLENILINDVEVITDDKTNKIKFCTDSIQIKLIDFGLAEYFGDHEDEEKEAKKETKAADYDYSSKKYVGKDNYKSPEVTAKKGSFCAKSNDIFTCGVCLFMMVMGCAPFQRASIEDELFVNMMNNKVSHVIEHWNRLHYITQELIGLLCSFFKYENKRITLNQILNHSFIN